MSFEREKFTLISAGFPGSTPKMWGYDTLDDYKTVLDIGNAFPNYFGDIQEQLTEGDLIQVRFSNFPEAPLTTTLKIQTINVAPQPLKTLAVPQSGFTFSARFPDISTASSIFIGMPNPMHIVYYAAVIEGAITGANVTFTLNKLFVGPIAGSSFTISQGGSAPGDIGSVFIPTDISRVVGTDSVLEVISDGASTGAVGAQITVVGL
jgi:hypothetical protein